MKTSKKWLSTLDIGSHINAAAQPLPEAGATQERTLEAVGCRRLFGADSVKQGTGLIMPLTGASPTQATQAVCVYLFCSLGNAIQSNVTVELYAWKPTLQRHKVPRNYLPQNSGVFHGCSAEPCKIPEELVEL